MSTHSLHSSTPKSSPRLPDIISHRGYKGKFPENTLCAIDGAVKAGTHALELDLHLTKDGVIVLSHDPSLQRCYGVKRNVSDCDWDDLKPLRTLNAPHEPIPRLQDVLEYIRQPGREHLWLLLDIKLANDPATIMRRIAETIESVPIAANGPAWHERIVLGCWSAAYLAPREEYLPNYELALICVHMDYARQFLQIPNISFNVNQYVLLGLLGRGFLEDALAARRRVFLWTVNEPNLMRWGIRHNVDGIITDDPALYNQIREEWETEQREGSHDSRSDRLTLGQRFHTILIMFFVLTFGCLLKRRVLKPLDRIQIEQRKTK